MSRLRADGLLLLTAIIWGFAFVAQKTGMEGLGPFGFIASRFILSFVVVLPFALREHRTYGPPDGKSGGLVLALSFIFFVGVALQQAGIGLTSVTNAGFLTGLYVLGTPAVAWALWKYKPSAIILPACLTAVAGTWFLNGASLDRFHAGDWLVLACALVFSVHVPLLGYTVQRVRRPLTLSAAQYAICAVLGLIACVLFEGGIGLDALRSNALQIFYAGVISGGVAYTLQAVAQQHTPSADAAVIMAGESLFAALGGALLLGERLQGIEWLGCALILAAILLVECVPVLRKFFVRQGGTLQNEGQN